MGKLKIILVFVFLVACTNCLHLETFYKYLDKTQKSTLECQLQKDIFLQALEDRTQWAVKMLDLFGRIPQAITQGNYYDLGMYDQCVNFFEQLNDVNIKGKYCFGGLSIPLADFKIFNANLRANSVLRISACVPDACLPSDLFGSYANDENCQTKNETKELDNSDIAFSVFLVFIILLMAASTIYDLHLQRHSKVTRHKILLAFSVYSNGKKIIQVNQQSGQILFFNGLKVISMFWVVLGHRFESNETMTINKADIKDWRRRWYAMYILLFSLSVDTFLFISGALLAYTFLRSMRKPNQKFNLLLYYVHRYFRLTPALAAVYFFQITLARKIVAGPYIPPNDILTGALGTTCKENWWSFFLYIQNYVSPNDMCLVHTWYVNVDMQLIIISPLLLMPMLRFPKRMTYIVLPSLIILVTIYTSAILYFYDLTRQSSNFDELYYSVTHTRLTPWLIGLIFGAFMLDFKANEQKYRIKNDLVYYIVWGLVFAFFAVAFVSEHDVRLNPDPVKSMYYYPLLRPTWALCIAWISYSCLCGRAVFVNWLLSLPFFQVLSKITYSTYLIHLSLIAMDVKYSRTLPYFSDYELIRTTIADIALASVAGAFWSLAFEYPGMNVEQALFGGGSIKKDCNSRTDTVLQKAHKEEIKGQHV